ncbi:MAG: sulfur carrier protein ThiS [Candidatus Omnitrophica bacterium]|nr:sulfur carrier protein ThiS [Candidatus Omnitrophota bacterium]
MNITLNGRTKEIASSQSLREVVQRFSPDLFPVIAEVNGTIVKKSQWDEICLNDGDTIELVGFVGGG